MSKFIISGIETESKPYTFIKGRNDNYVHLGVKMFLGNRLPTQLGVDMDLARAEAVPLFAHNAFENYWLYTDKPSVSIAMLGIITNKMSPDELYHLQPNVFDKFKKELKNMSDRDAKNAAIIGADELAKVVVVKPHLFDNPQQDFKNLLLLPTMLNGDGLNNPRNWLVDTMGVIKPRK